MSDPRSICAQGFARKADEIFVRISDATSKIAHMEEVHGTDSPQHHDAINEREKLIRRYREARRMEAHYENGANAA